MHPSTKFYELLKQIDSYILLRQRNLWKAKPNKQQTTQAEPNKPQGQTAHAQSTAAEQQTNKTNNEPNTRQNKSERTTYHKPTQQR